MLIKKKVLFLTGTRADFGKLKPLIRSVDKNDNFEAHIFITGMHLLGRYGWTFNEVIKEGFKNTFQYTNQSYDTTMDIALSNTIIGFSNYVNELKPDLIVIHGDRLEALAAAIVGSFNNIHVAHIEGGEISGTIDESIRHAISKFAHFHYVCFDDAKKRLLQLGESPHSIRVIGSPDIDIMLSDNLPSLINVKEKYDISFEKYAILLFHPVTTEVDLLPFQIKNLIDALIDSKKNYVVIYPNNDPGTNIIINEFSRLKSLSNFRVIPSLRFEFFLSLLKNALFIIGNSSAGIREAEVYGICTINIGSRQNGRSINKSIIHVSHECEKILIAIKNIDAVVPLQQNLFGFGNSAELFMRSLSSNEPFDVSLQKFFNCK